MSRSADPRPMPAGRRPRGRPGYSRDDVLRQAIDLFNTRGYDATSISDLARHLGITKSAIFHHFDSKEAILAAALEEALAGLSNTVSTAAHGDDTSAYGRLRATVEASVNILAEHLPAVTLLLRIRGNSPLELAAMQRRRDIDAQLSSLVQAAADEGYLRGDVPAEVTSRLIFGLVNSLVEWYQPGGKISQAALASAVTTVLFDGLRSATPLVPVSDAGSTGSANPGKARRHTRRGSC